jgi:SWIM zinc finger
MKLTIDLDTDNGDVTLSADDFRELVRKAAPKPTLTDQQARDAMRAAGRDTMAGRVHVGTDAWFELRRPKPEPRVYTYNIQSYSNIHVMYRVLVITDAETGVIKKITCTCPDYQYKTARGVLDHVCKHGADARIQHRAKVGQAPEH